jgi:hypothetical protein
VLGGTWLGQLAGWRAPFIMLAAVGALAALAVSRLLPSPEARDGDTSRGTHPDALQYRLLLVTVAIMVTGFYAGYTFISPFLTGVSGLAETAVGPVLLLRGLAGLIGVFIGGRVAAGRAWAAVIRVSGAGRRTESAPARCRTGLPGVRHRRRRTGTVGKRPADRRERTNSAGRQPGQRDSRRTEPGPKAIRAARVAGLSTTRAQRAAKPPPRFASTDRRWLR